MQILVDVMATNLGDLGKFLSMMDFLVVVLFQDHLDMQPECQLQKFELMNLSSLVRAMSHTILLVLIRLGLLLFLFLNASFRQVSYRNAYSCGLGVMHYFFLMFLYDLI
jgi:hypothetical protein